MPTSVSVASRVVRPRVASVPPSDYSDGADAIALAASAGLNLDPWQRYILENALGVREDGLWSAFEVGLIVGRQNGKGAILEARELFGLFLVEDERLILHSAHEFKTATEAFRRILALVEGTPDLRKQVKKVQIGHGDEGIELRDGSRLRFVARSTGSGRGFTGDLIILDEAYALTDKHMEALLPTLSARPNPQLWYTSTPPLDPGTGGQLMALRERGLAGADRLAYFEYSVEGELDKLDRIDLDDRGLWAEANPALGIRISEEFIERERSAMTREGFARERLCVFPPPLRSGSRAIPRELWESLATAQREVPEQLAIAVVVNKARTHSYIGYAGLMPDDRILVALAERPRRGTDGVVERLVQLKAERDPVAIAVDTRSEALLVEMQKAGLSVPEDPDKPERGDLAVMTANQVAAAFGMFIDAAQQRRLAHPDDAAVTAALLEAGTRSLAGGTAWDDAGASVEIAPLRAVTAALWALESRAHLIDSSEELEPWVGFG